MRPVEANYGYEVQQFQDHYELSYRGGKWGIGYGLLAALLLVPSSLFISLAVLGEIVFRSVPMIVFILAGLFFGIGSSIFVIYFRNKRRPTKTILIYRDSLVFGDREYALQHVTDLYVKAPNNKVHQSTRIAADTSTLSGMGAAGVFGIAGVAASGLNAMTSAVSQIGDGIGGAGISLVNREKGKRGWSIWFDYGATPMRLAKGLDKRRANLMFQELSRLTAHRPHARSATG